MKNNSWTHFFRLLKFNKLIFYPRCWRNWLSLKIKFSVFWRSNCKENILTLRFLLQNGNVRLSYEKKGAKPGVTILLTSSSGYCFKNFGLKYDTTSTLANTWQMLAYRIIEISRHMNRTHSAYLLLERIVLNLRYVRTCET